eukprot:7347986-Pyramimonas_sp.AAC.1
MGGQSSPADRRTARAGLGKLRDARIGAATLARYRRAAQQFIDYLNAMNLPLPFSWEDMDVALQDYLEYLWAEGATK